MQYVLDTNVFNRILDGKLQLSALSNCDQYVVTNVQLRELEATPDALRRELLVQIFHQVTAEHALTESFAWDIPGSGWGESKWNSDDGKRINSLKTSLDFLHEKPNNMQDAIIAEVALVNGYGLITADGDLARVASQHGIDVRHLAA
ncbi:MAG: hypothetical protein NTX84_00995 [Nitrospirae bacterium]|nr:hypothetical protein [Nitrospirota bacterium]